MDRILEIAVLGLEVVGTQVHPLRPNDAGQVLHGRPMPCGTRPETEASPLTSMRKMASSYYSGLCGTTQAVSVPNC